MVRAVFDMALVYGIGIGGDVDGICYPGNWSLLSGRGMGRVWMIIRLNGSVQAYQLVRGIRLPVERAGSYWYAGGDN